MIKHIVLWKLKDEANGLSKNENAKAIKQKLESLKDKIEGLVNIEVGIDFLHSAESADLGNSEQVPRIFLQLDVQTHRCDP